MFVDDNADVINYESFSQSFYTDNVNSNVTNELHFNSHSRISNVHQNVDFLPKNSTNEAESSHDINLDDLDLWLIKNDDVIDNILSQTKSIELKDPETIFNEISLECEQISKSPSSSPAIVSNDLSIDFGVAPINIDPQPVVKQAKRRKRGPPNELRKVKKRGQNRRAASKYRVKKKIVKECLESEYDQLMKHNISLKSQISTIQEQVEYFRSSLNRINLPQNYNII